jgi:hypothetical protein
MCRKRNRFYKIALEKNPWLPTPDIPDLLEKADPVIKRHPRGEAPITVGSVLHHWKRGGLRRHHRCRPWGCGPAMISESPAQASRQIPKIFIYNDGTPIDERRLNGFVFRLRREEPRAKDKRKA